MDWTDWAQESFREEAAERGTPRPDRWRVGGKIPLNVYEGDRPVCQCHNEDDARRIVDAMNHRCSLDELLKQCGPPDRRLSPPSPDLPLNAAKALGATGG